MVGLGPAGADLVTAGTLEVIRASRATFCRTLRHPAAEELFGTSGGATAAADGPATAHRPVRSFDSTYENEPTFSNVYASIVAELIDAASELGNITYAVPGSPTVAETTVEMLLAEAALPGGPQVVVHPAMSFADLAWARLGVDPVQLGARLVDGHRFGEMVGGGGPLLVAQCESPLTLSEVKLTLEDPPDGPVVLLQRLGLPDELVQEVDWADIDRSVEPDHLTSLWIPDAPSSAGAHLDDMATLMEQLRSADAWKAAQSHETLRRYLIEESYEVLEALDDYDPRTGEGSEELAAELGDLLYQIVFHSSLASEAGWFDLNTVVRAIHDKLVSRHPHVPQAGDPEGGGIPSPSHSVGELASLWEQSKRAELGRESAFDGIPASLPALVRAMAVTKKASALGLEIPEPAPGVGGDLLVLALAAIATGADPEDELRRELRRIEGVLRSQGQ